MEFHAPVLLRAIIDLFSPLEGKTIVDATLGGGGHSQALLKKGAQVIAFDQDEEAIKYSQEHLKKEEKIYFIQDNFDQIEKNLKNPVDGFLFDLGISSWQINKPERGFSFSQMSPLDMRMDKKQKTTAADLLNSLSEEELVDIFFKWGEEKFSRRIARNILKKRTLFPIKNSLELSQIISTSLPNKNPIFIRKSCARIFQALRIAVNQELSRLQIALPQALSCLKHKGRIIIISYHSLEDRLVKNFFREKAKDCICPPKSLKCLCQHRSELKIVTRKPILPTEEEITQNPRARSARLRAAEKI